MEKINVLNIASILPMIDFGSKQQLKENDFLIIVGKYLERLGVNSSYIKTVSYSNNLLSKFNSKWAALNDIPESYDYKDVSINTIKIISLPQNRMKRFCNSMSLLLNKRKLNKFIEQGNFTCIHAHSLLFSGSMAYYLSKKFDIPYVLTIRNESKFLQYKSTRKISRKIIRDASRILTTNEVNKKKLSKYVNREITVITHGVDEENFYESLKINSPMKIVTVGKLNKGKKIDLLISALKKIENKNFTLSIVGDGPEYNYLKSISYDINCEFLGEIPHHQVISLLKESDIFVLPSEYESFGRVYIEAMASSNAVIAVKDTGIHGLFEENKEVLYMERNSEESLISKLEVLINNSEYLSTIKMNAYSHTRNKYSWEEISHKYYDVYNDTKKGKKND